MGLPVRIPMGTWAMTTKEQNRAFRQRQREKNVAYVREINEKTVCAHCGAQPIEWHNPEHVTLGRAAYRISNMVWHPRSVVAIQAEIERCTPLCRRCHMEEDGRLVAIAASGHHPSQPPKPCAQCEQPTKPLRRGLCRRDYDANRRRSSTELVEAS